MELKRQGKAVEIVFINENKLSFCETALRAILNKVGNRPVSVVSINGPMISEKSYILSQCLKYITNHVDNYWYEQENDAEFQWTYTETRHTPGISMWSEPVIIRKSGDEIAVLFMDVHGCFDSKTSTSQELLIFALSFVLSSNLIYSIPEQLSNDVLQFLQMFVRYTKGSIDSETTEYFFKLIFMIRGWQLTDDYKFGYHDNNSYAGERNYKTERFFCNSKDMKEISQFYNQYTLINFDKIACCLMPGNESLLCDENHSLSSTFVETVRDIVPKILHPSNVILKRFGQHKFNGQQLIKLFDQLAVLFAKNEMMSAVNVDIYTTELQIFISHLTAFNHYVWKMDNIINGIHYYDDDELKKMHEINKEAAFVSSISNTPANEIIRSKYHDLLHVAIESSLEFYLKANEIKFNLTTTENRTDKMTTEAKAKIKELKKNSSISFTKLDSSISKLIGFDLEGLTGVVSNVFGINAKNFSKIG